MQCHSNMENIVSRLNNTFEDTLTELKGVYIGRIKNEMEAMFHLAYWLYCEHKTDAEVKTRVFKMAPFTIEKTTEIDLNILINKAKQLL